MTPLLLAPLIRDRQRVGNCFHSSIRRCYGGGCMPSVDSYYCFLRFRMVRVLHLEHLSYFQNAKKSSCTSEPSYEHP
jgi:hypothetical protein